MFLFTNQSQLCLSIVLTCDDSLYNIKVINYFRSSNETPHRPKAYGFHFNKFELTSWPKYPLKAVHNILVFL